MSKEPSYLLNSFFAVIEPLVTDHVKPCLVKITALVFIERSIGTNWQGISDGEHSLVLIKNEETNCQDGVIPTATLLLILLVQRKNSGLLRFFPG